MTEENKNLRVTMREDHSNPENELRRDQDGKILTGESPNHNESVRSDDQFDPTIQENSLRDQPVNDESKAKKEKSSFDSFANSVGPVSSRATASNPDDIAGVADLDNKLNR